MKHRITFFAVLMMALAIPQSVMAYDFSAQAPSGQTLYYSIIDASSVSVVSEIGDYPYYTDVAKPTGDLVIPSSVTDGGTMYSVTSIGNYAFEYCSGLTSVTIPNGVTSIGGHAFRECYGLTSVTIPEGVTSIGYYAFAWCNGLTSVTIPSSVTSIGNEAFELCSSLTSVTIPSSVTSIGDYAFRDCSGLTSISVESENTVYDSREGCNAIIETATNTLIAGCMNTVIPEGVTSIGDYAFYECIGLTSVTIPEGVTSIGNSAFFSCSGLTSISVENGNTVYDSREGCNAIIETATNTLIVGCMNTVIPGSVTSIGGYAFYNCRGLTSVTIPEGVTSIGDGAFWNCSGLTSVTIPGSVTSIGETAFSGCRGLTSVTIPEGITSIGNEAFELCSGLTSVTIPSSVTSIGETAFAWCYGLTSIESLAMVPPTMGTNVFYDAPTDIPVYVPCGKVADYQAANGWSSFTNIQEICGTPGTTGVSVYADGNDIVVEGAAGNTVTLYDNGGNTHSTSTAPTGTPLRFEGLANGSYYVKIGVLPARMKVEVR